MFVELAMIENAIFPYKIALPKANVKTNRIGCIKCTQNKEQSFVTNYFIHYLLFFENLISI